MPYCTNCGNANPDEARFCSQCGRQLVGEAPAAGGDSTATIGIAGGERAEIASTRDVHP
jgi:uncharacterized membrane protein YvbJ